MKIFVDGVPDVELESPMTGQQLSILIDAVQQGIAHVKILVMQGKKLAYIDVEDIDIARTLKGVIFDGRPRSTMTS